MAPLSAPGTGRARAVLFADVLLLVLPMPFVALRWWSRQMTRSRLALNDYLIIAALLFTTGFSINSICSSILGGYGQHILNLTKAELNEFSKALVIATVLWPSANALIKLSILHFYNCVFFCNRRTVQASYVLMGLTACYWLAGIIMAFAICVPFEYNWNKTINGHCGDVSATYLAIAIINLVVDVMIVALPLPSVWALQMQTSRKVALTFIFSLGAIICVISIVRCWAIATLDESDAPYSVVLDQVFATLELTLGIVNACLPLLQPILTWIVRSKPGSFLKSFFTRSSRGSSGEALQKEDYYRSFPSIPKRRPRQDGLTTSLARDDDYDDGVHDGEQLSVLESQTTYKKPRDSIEQGSLIDTTLSSGPVGK